MKKNEKGLYTASLTYNGRRYYVRAKTEKELYKRLNQKQRDLEEGKITINGKTTVKRWSTEWLETYKGNSVRTASYERYQSIIKNYLTDIMGEVRMQDVRPIHLQKILNGIDEKSADHVKKVKETMFMIFDRARMNGIIYGNPAADLEMPKTRENGSRRAITDNERKHILALAETHDAGLWLKLMLYCGLRPGETAALQWSDISFGDKPRINVKSAIEKRTGEIKPPKSKAGIRSIPIPKTYAEELQAKKPADDPFGFVFRQRSGEHFTETSMHTLWKNFKIDLDIAMGAEYKEVGQRKRKVIDKSVVAKDLVPYCLRHTYCTDLQAAGVPINVAKELMGHSKIEMTSRIYTHSSETAIDSAAEYINAFHSKSSVAPDVAPEEETG